MSAGFLPSRGSVEIQGPAAWSVRARGASGVGAGFTTCSCRARAQAGLPAPQGEGPGPRAGEQGWGKASSLRLL